MADLNFERAYTRTDAEEDVSKETEMALVWFVECEVESGLARISRGIGGVRHCPKVYLTASYVVATRQK